MNRISPTDNVGVAIAVMGDRKQLALIALQALHTLGSRIDPAAGEDAGLNAMKSLDSMGIYGDDLARLFTGACKLNPTNLMAVCKAAQIGVLSQDTVKLLAAGKIPPGVNVAQLVSRLQVEVPGFGSCGEDCEALPDGDGHESGVF